jgi:hypothetical protein
MLQWLRAWLRPVRCKNFDCCYEWNGKCRAKKMKMGIYDRMDLASLKCHSFKQTEGD